MYHAAFCQHRLHACCTLQLNSYGLVIGKLRDTLAHTPLLKHGGRNRPRASQSEPGQHITQRTKCNIVILQCSCALFSKAVWSFALETASILMLPVYLHCTTRSCWVTGLRCLGLSEYTLRCLYYDDTTQCGTSYYLTSSYVVRLLPSSIHTQIQRSAQSPQCHCFLELRSENCRSDHKHRNSVN